MEYKILDILKTAGADKKESTFLSNDFKEYIKNGYTINLYKDRLAKYIYNQCLNKNEIDYKQVGISFLILFLYAIDGNIDYKELKKAIPNLNNDIYIKATELIKIYNNTIYPNYIQHINGAKGGAKNKNTNAKKVVNTDNLIIFIDNFIKEHNYNIDNEKKAALIENIKVFLPLTNTKLSKYLLNYFKGGKNE